MQSSLGPDLTSQFYRQQRIRGHRQQSSDFLVQRSRLGRDDGVTIPRLHRLAAVGSDLRQRGAYAPRQLCGLAEQSVQMTHSLGVAL